MASLHGEIGPLTEGEIHGLEMRYEASSPPWTIRRDWERDAVDQWSRNAALLAEDEPFIVRPVNGGWAVMPKDEGWVEWFPTYKQADTRRHALQRAQP